MRRIYLAITFALLSLAVLPFSGAAELVLVLDCEAGKESFSLAETVTGIAISVVSETQEFDAVSPESRDRALAELEFALSDLAQESTRTKIGALTSADAVLGSKISTGEGELFLVLTLTEVETGAVAASVTQAYRSAGTLIDGVEGQVLQCLGLESARDDRRVIRVKNATELVQAIGPDRIIRLAPGRYDLTDKYLVKNRYVDWVDDFDGPCPIVKNVSNLALIGEARAEIVIAPAYGWVLGFETCSGLRISDLIVGHTKPGYCMGGVLRFARCDDVEIRSCDLYGSGTYGLGLERTERFTIVDSQIRDCTYGLATIERCSDLLFDSTAFKNSGEFNLFDIAASEHILMTDCVFSGNRGETMFSVDAETIDFRAASCQFTSNKTLKFSSRKDAPILESARFRSNRFPVPSSGPRR